jgi:hypothetical protein
MCLGLWRPHGCVAEGHPDAAALEALAACPGGLLPSPCRGLEALAAYSPVQRDVLL